MLAPRLLPSALTLLLLALAQLGRAQNYQGRELVKAELLANTTAISPGKSFKAAVLLRMAPGWHTYWKFPGDAGIPSEVKWNLPPGWKVDEIQWPTPLKLVEPGDIQIYGYHEEVLLMQEITPPAVTAGGSSAKLSAEASWLVCEKICIPGSATVQLDLPVGDAASPANEELFARFERTLPQPWPNEKVASATWSRSGTGLTLRVKSDALANYPAVDFYPAPGEKIVVSHPTSERQSDGVIFHIPIETDEPNVASIPGVVVFGQTDHGSDRNAWDITGATAAAASSKVAVAAPAVPSLAAFLFFGFLGGLILNLMPCVLPVISLKIFGFVRQAGESRARIFKTGLAFIAGIFALFMGLAVLTIVLKAGGREATWGFQFHSPYFVLVMSALVLVFALNLFGVFEISLPGAANSKLLKWTEGDGYLGSFAQGVFATILATPCLGPYLGTALGIAFTQSSANILLLFFAIAAGMSLPYVLLSAEPAWLRFIPKPGPWMVRVKQFMGFLLLGTLLFLLYVLGAQKNLDAVIWASVFLLALSIACWMKGAFLTPLASGPQRFLVIVLMLALVLGSGAYCIGDKFASAQPALAGERSTGGWIAFTPERLDHELKQGRPVFLDFTAAWCVTCKFNEATVLESTAVREAFARRGVVKLKADWTNADPAITKMLKQFGRPGVPLYVLYPAGKSAQPIVLPELLTKNIVLQKLETLAPQVAAD